jgi:hypothetical protein
MPEESCRSVGGHFASAKCGRPGPLDRDRDCTDPPVAARGPASCGASDREVVLLVAASTATPDAPQRGDKEICESLSSRCILLVMVFCCEVDLLRGLLLRLTFLPSCRCS